MAQPAVEILNLIDDHSRLAIASRFRPTVSSHDFVDVFTDAPSFGSVAQPRTCGALGSCVGGAGSRCSLSSSTSRTAPLSDRLPVVL